MRRQVRWPVSILVVLIGLLLPSHADVLPEVTADTAVVSASSAPTAASPAPLRRSTVAITDIGTVNGRSSTGAGINSGGDVAGFSYVTGTIGIPNGPPAEPFLTHGVLFADGMLQDLGAIEGYPTCSPLGCQSLALDVNDSRWIVGWNDGDYGLQALLWLPQDVPGGAAGFNLLPPLSALHGSAASAINASGRIVGRSSPDGIISRAVVWHLEGSGPTVADLGTLRADNAGSAMAYDINDLGQIVGAAADAAYYQKGFLYLPEPSYGLPAGMNDLMTGIDDYGHAAGINNRGEVVGEIDLGVPWVWLPASAYGLPAGFSLLPLTREVVAFFPAAISDAGQIVGEAYLLLNPHTREYKRVAAAWRDGRWIYLDSLLPPRSPWSLITATGIARSGRTTLVTGGGWVSGIVDVNGFSPAFHGYVLVVTCTADFNEDGKVDVSDQRILVSHLREQVPPGTLGDLDGDGVVTPADLRIFADQIGQPCL